MRKQRVTTVAGGRTPFGKAVKGFNLRKWLVAAGGLAAVFAVAAGLFFVGTGWELSSRVSNGALLFTEHITPGPGTIYTTAENVEMALKVDMVRFVTDELKRSEIPALLWFGDEVGVGEKAPAFEMQTTSGDTLRLQDLRGRNAVFMFAAMTCPPARAQTPRLGALQSKYDPADVAFFLIYSRERHAGERGFPEFSPARTNEEKMAYARMLDELTTLPIAVDDIEETALRLYGEVPNATYVIDRQGTIVFRSTWADSRKVEKVLDALLEFQSGRATNARSVPTP